jgi:ketosteroid isomerase-like protein
MTSIETVAAWVNNYRKAWESNDPEDIAVLFAEDAAYYPEPFAKPWTGREKIVEEWLKIKDDPGTTTFAWHPMIVTEELVVIEGTTRYPRDTYSNLWILQLDDSGRARQFTEWWMMHRRG